VLEAHRHRVLHGEWKRAVAALSSGITLQVGHSPFCWCCVTALSCYCYFPQALQPTQRLQKLDR
jgi:hypothetical protein